jgi:hypothetical protein
MCQGTVSKSESRTPTDSRGQASRTRPMIVHRSRVRPTKSPPHFPGLLTAVENGGTAWKSHWLATVLVRWEARSAIEATAEPSGSESRNQGAKIPDEQRASADVGWHGC